jgi:hypothetical protein
MMKVSGKVKVFCYVCLNFGVVFWSVILLLEGFSAQRSLLIFLVSGVAINLLTWTMFRLKEQE